VHERTIRRALAAGTLTGHTVAGRWRIEPDDLERWLSNGAPTTATPTNSTGRLGRKAGATAGADAIAGAGAGAGELGIR
jgi:excisionase family DNA binding protein